MFKNLFSENCFVSEIMWKNMIQPARTTDSKIWHLLFVCWLDEAIDTPSECVTPIVFHVINGYAVSLQCYNYSSLPLLFCVFFGKSSFYINFSHAIHKRTYLKRSVSIKPIQRQK